MAFLNFTTGAWTIYPTSTVPYTPWVLTYFDGSNGSAVWFNEHYANRMGVIYDNATQLTEYNISNPPLYNLTTITDPTNGTNMVTMAVAQDGAWFAAAGGFVGYVNGSYVPPFSISIGSSSVQVTPADRLRRRSTSRGTRWGATSRSSSLTTSSTTGRPSCSLSVPPCRWRSSGGTDTVSLNIEAATGIQPGTYIAAATVTDGSIYRSVYFTVLVT